MSARTVIISREFPGLGRARSSAMAMLAVLSSDCTARPPPPWADRACPEVRATHGPIRGPSISCDTFNQLHQRFMSLDGLLQGRYELRVAGAMPDGPGEFQRFSVELLSVPKSVEVRQGTLVFWAERRLVDLTGASLVYESVYERLPGSHPDVLGVTANALRTSTGQLLFAHAVVAFEQPLNATLPEFRWSQVDLGCPYDPDAPGLQRKRIALDLELEGRERIQLGVGQSVDVQVGCATGELQVQEAEVTNSQREPKYATRPLPSQIDFNFVRHGLLAR